MCLAYVPVFQEDLEVPVDRKVLADQAKGLRPPRKADRVVQANRMCMAYQVVPVFREDLEVQVDRKVLAGRARPPSKEGSLVVLAKVARGASPGSRRNARRTLTCLCANSSRAWVRAC
jgi:hypothetical protein